MDDPIAVSDSPLGDDAARPDDKMVGRAGGREEEPCPDNDGRPLRSIFAYPVELTVFTSKSANISFRGCLRDISANGACVEFEDRHGRCNLNEMQDAKIKISFSILEGERVDAFARVQWVKKAAGGTGAMKMGIEFRYLESWDAIDHLIGMKNKDRSMMWNLWEQLLE